MSRTNGPALDRESREIAERLNPKGTDSGTANSQSGKLGSALLTLLRHKRYGGQASAATGMIQQSAQVEASAFVVLYRGESHGLASRSVSIKLGCNEKPSA